ncbi:MAG TPA: NTP transferase domain-containing protein [Candidatus Tyrphobacter sp.]
MIYVVLAAGESRRMGFAKVFAPLRGRSPLERIAALLEGREAIVVVPPERRRDAQRMAPRMRMVPNGEPGRGMTHSLRLALEAVEADADFGILLGDEPFLSRATLERIEEAFAGVDVAYPVNAEGVPGHPVIFAARLRARLRELPDGDALSQLRDDSSLVRSVVRCDDPGAYRDLNEPADWEAADA